MATQLLVLKGKYSTLTAVWRLHICEKVAENGDLGGCFLHAFHRTPSCRAILKYNTVPLPHRHPLPHRSPPQPDSSNSLLQNSPEVSCKCRKVLRSKREVVLQW